MINEYINDDKTSSITSKSIFSMMFSCLSYHFKASLEAFASDSALRRYLRRSAAVPRAQVEPLLADEQLLTQFLQASVPQMALFGTRFEAFRGVSRPRKGLDLSGPRLGSDRRSCRGRRRSSASRSCGRWSGATSTRRRRRWASRRARRARARHGNWWSQGKRAKKRANKRAGWFWIGHHGHGWRLLSVSGKQGNLDSCGKAYRQLSKRKAQNSPPKPFTQSQHRRRVIRALTALIQSR